jgi:ABC-type phosphate transport system substrate-binding protein
MLETIRIVAAGLLLALFVCACAPVTAPVNGETLQGEITVSGAFALYPLVTRWAEEFQRSNPGVRFDIASGGAPDTCNFHQNYWTSLCKKFGEREPPDITLYSTQGEF